MEMDFPVQQYIPEELYRKLFEVAEVFHKNGFSCYLVGGFLRDILLKRGTGHQDIDIATDATPQEVMGMFRRVIPTGIRHGTVTILYKGLKIECTTFRKEFTYSDSRHPDSVEFAKTIEEDLSRRDFTVNALAFDMKSHKLIDLYDGIGDLQKKLLRCVGDPEQRFTEDGLRPVRALRFSATLEFEIEEQTLRAILKERVRASIKNISVERFTDELEKGFRAKKTSRMLGLLYELKILELFLEPSWLKVMPARFFEYLDSLESPGLKMAYWFWYQGFDPQSAGKVLKFSNQKIKYISVATAFIEEWLRQHPFLVFRESELLDFSVSSSGTSQPERKTYRKLLSFLKKNLDTKSTDFLMEAKKWMVATVYPEIRNAWQQTLEGVFQWMLYALKQEPLLPGDLAIDGEDLLGLGFRGKEIGEILRKLLEFVWENPELNKKELLMEKINQARDF